MGYSPDTFYRHKEMHDNRDAAALQDMSRRKHILKNRVAPEIANCKLTIEKLTPGQQWVAKTGPVLVAKPPLRT
jgi:hypothetical protein